MIEENQIKEIKEKLIQQIKTTFPEEKKESAINQIESMNKEQLEEFLIKNNLLKENGEQPKEQQCIFCMINSGEIPSHKIGENEEAIATLEINPISKGHTIIIPKIHEQKEITDTIINLSNEISKKIKTKLQPKEIDIAESTLFGHKILNIIPVYENENINSPRTKAEKEELEQLQKELSKEIPEKNPEKEKIEEIEKKEINEQNTWLPKRIP